MKRLAVLAAAVALAASANAATVSFDFLNPLATTDIQQTGNLGLFDSSLGTLTGASITVNGAALMSFSGSNTAAQRRNATVTSTVVLSWSSMLTGLNAFLTDTVLMSATSGQQRYAVGETKLFGPFNPNGSNTDNLASILSSLQVAGGGSFDVSCESSSGLAVSGGGGNIGASQSTQAQCGASIVYTYDSTPPTDVPEPGSLALIGLGLAGLAVARRHKSV